MNFLQVSSRGCHCHRFLAFSRGPPPSVMGALASPVTCSAWFP